MESGVQKHETGGDEDLGVVSLQVVLQAMGHGLARHWMMNAARVVKEKGEVVRVA